MNSTVSPPHRFYHLAINPSHKSLSLGVLSSCRGTSSIQAACVACVEEQQIIGQGFCLIAMGTRVDRQFRGLEKQQRATWEGVGCELRAEWTPRSCYVECSKQKQKSTSEQKRGVWRELKRLMMGAGGAGVQMKSDTSHGFLVLLFMLKICETRWGHSRVKKGGLPTFACQHCRNQQIQNRKPSRCLQMIYRCESLTGRCATWFTLKHLITRGNKRKKSFQRKCRRNKEELKQSIWPKKESIHGENGFCRQKKTSRLL